MSKGKRRRGWDGGRYFSDDVGVLDDVVCGGELEYWDGGLDLCGVVGSTAVVSGVVGGSGECIVRGGSLVGGDKVTFVVDGDGGVLMDVVSGGSVVVEGEDLVVVGEFEDGVVCGEGDLLGDGHEDVVGGGLSLSVSL